MKLKSVTHFPDTNSVEVTWVEVVTPESTDAEGNVTPAVEHQVRCHSYAAVQMGMLEADLGTDLPAYADLIATVRAGILPPTAQDIAAEFAAAKTAKNIQINAWRATANQTTFPHAGKLIACDALSRSDIDAVANSVSLTGAFPAGFPGAWKAVDNTYIMLPNVDAFKAMHASMTLQGTINFGRSQTLKADLAAATTLEQVNALTWEA